MNLCPRCNSPFIMVGQNYVCTKCQFTVPVKTNESKDNNKVQSMNDSLSSKQNEKHRM